MPVQLQCAAVVIRNDALDRCIDGGSENFREIAPNGIWYSDGMLTQASFMSWVDSEQFAKSLELRGLSRHSSQLDFTLVHEKDQSVEPPADWLILFEYENRLIATMAGNKSRTVIAPDMEHDPDSIQHFTQEEADKYLEFVERKDNVDTYRHKETGQLVYSARHTESDDEIYDRVSAIVWKDRRQPGDEPAVGQLKDTLIAAIEELQGLAARNPDSPQVFLSLGSAWFTIGNADRASKSIIRAHELAPESYGILKELGSVLLSQNDFERSIEYGLKAVAIEPDNIELLGNLAVSQLLSGDSEKATQTIDHALSLDGQDSVNKNIKQVLNQIENQGRPIPKSLPDMMKPWKPKRAASFWSRLFRKLPG